MKNRISEWIRIACGAFSVGGLFGSTAQRINGLHLSDIPIELKSLLALFLGPPGVMDKRKITT